MLKKALVAMAFSSEMIPMCKTIVLKNIKKVSTQNLKDAFEKFSEYFKVPYGEMGIQEYVGIVLVDGLSGAEENLMDSIGKLTNIYFIGGSAGDDLKFKKTQVFAGAQAYDDSAILTIIKPSSAFEILKTQSFDDTGIKLIATKVDEEKREVIEFDNKPAVQAYAEALGIESSQVANSFMTNPLGLVIEDEPYVRSPQQVVDTKIVFYCNVKEGMELSVLKSRNIVSETRQALTQKLKEMGETSAIINFNCILRTLELYSTDQSDDYGNLFNLIPTIGFSTYGEQLIGHINQTATMLLLK
jgi:hypothetical protein